MTGRIYMGNDFRRDHSFRVPRPDQTLKYGTPNACNGCHDDKDAKWANDFIIKSYGPERLDHFSNHLIKGSLGDTDALKTLFSDSKYPEIARATAIDQYSESIYLSDTVLTEMIPLLQDESAMVRNQTVVAFERSQNSSFNSYIKPLLNDSIRTVRISAARYFHMNNIEFIDNEFYKKAHKEYLNYLDVNSDFPSGQLQIAIHHQIKNEIEHAIEAYKKSISFDVYFNQSKINLAFIYYQQGKIDEAEDLYLQVIALEPDFGYSYYMLGLLYNEKGDIENAKKYLNAATSKNPPNANAYYNYAILLQQEGKYEDSLNKLNEGLKLFSDNERLLYIKVLALLNLKENNKAIAITQKLIQLSPNNPDYINLYQSLINR